MFSPNSMRQLFCQHKCVRCYTSAAKRSVLRQDLSKIPTHQYPIAKPGDSRVYVWGMAATGALGVQTSVKKQAKAYADYVQHPSRLNFAENRDILDVAAGYGFSAFAASCQGGQSLWGTGINTDSQIGYHKLGGKHRKPFELLIYPAPINLSAVAGNNKGVKIVKVAAGRAHTLALAQNGSVYALGNNAYGQCGRSIIKNEDYFHAPLINRIDQLNNERVKDVDCGQDHSFFLTESGKLYSCGWSDDGQTGQEKFGLISIPAPVEGDVKGEQIVKVTGTADTVLALNDQGDVFVWGYGILGFGPEVIHKSRPCRIPPTLFGRNDFNPSCRIRSIYAGVTHSGAINDQDDLYMWGHNRHGCLGFGNKKDQFFPLKVAVNARVLKISCGVDHTLALCKAFV
ncbi:RCC1-like G exchanging factor-like protein isoform X2 [Wyeomyia smithii]|uniref:RCC1-like G exchanging factor-like protein isoform X2 n=1 Tax=Wyeomyia smithii TaxID=174621 RepID=UPI002467F5CB|nr:RCC1-like G exchanging factor-like protein isoform X2 [Wyeomyia smithii]